MCSSVEPSRLFHVKNIHAFTIPKIENKLETTRATGSPETGKYSSAKRELLQSICVVSCMQ